MPHAHIVATGSAVPDVLTTERFLQVDAEARRLHGQSRQTIERIASLVRGTGIQARHTFHPALLPPGSTPRVAVDDIYTDTEFDPDLWQRMRAWRQVVPALAVEAVSEALTAWGGPVDRISHILTTSTSGWSEPGLACELIDTFGLRHDCQKAELNFNGCFCGATCLRLARDIVRAGEADHVLVVAAESPSTHYSPVETDISTLVAHCLFSDGAAALILGPEGAWRMDSAGMHLVPGSRELLQMVPPMSPDQVTYRMYLDRAVGPRLGAWLGTGEPGPRLLARLGSGLEAPPAMAVHPGGPNILQHVGAALEASGYPSDVLTRSYTSLQHHGNLGAAALPFLLAEHLGEVEGPALGTLAFGPGVTVEWARYLRV